MINSLSERLPGLNAEVFCFLLFYVELRANSEKKQIIVNQT